MAMTPLERKAAFKAAVTLAQTTLETASVERVGVTWYHLSEGIAEKRPLSAEVKQRFANYIGRRVDDVFDPQEAAA